MSQIIDFSEIEDKFEELYELAEKAITHESLNNQFADEGDLQKRVFQVIQECIENKSQEDF